MRILLVEDHADLADTLAKAIGEAGFAVDVVGRGDHADHLLLTQHYDLVVLDLTLPGLDGLEVLRRQRARKSLVPVLILTARGATDEKVKGLDLGADDYLAKPFELEELEARMRALLRRSSAVSPVVRAGRLEFDTVSRLARIEGEAVALTPRELMVLEALLFRLGKAVSREMLYEKVFKLDEEARPEALEIYVCRVRKKLAASGLSLVTLRGLGYMLEEGG